MKKYFFIFLILMMYSGALRADVSVVVSVTPARATLEDEIILTVTVNGSQSAGEPQLPSIPAFKIIPSGTASSIQIINGAISSSKQYNYVLIPQAEGSFTINSITVNVGSQEYKSDPVNLIVSHATASNKPAPSQTIPLPGITPLIPPPQTQQVSPDKQGKDYWIETSVTNKSPYISEQILFTFRFYTRVRVGDTQLTLPDFKDFWAEEVVPEKKFYQEIGGDRFVVSEKVLALHTLRVGEIQIPETELITTVPDQSQNNPFNDPFFAFGGRMKEKHLRAPAINLVSKALPEMPDDFTNLVGQFQIEASLSDKEVKVGDSTTLTVTLSGLGNIKDGVLPLKIDQPGLKVYEDKAQVDTLKSEQGIRGRKIFKMALVPAEAREFTLAEKNITFFNPNTENYEPLSLPAFTFTALPSANENLNLVGSNVTETSNVAPAEDIASIHTEVGDFVAPTSYWKLFWICLFLPPFIYGLIIFYNYKKKQNSRTNHAKISKMALKRLVVSLKKSASVKDFNAVMEAIKQYVIERLRLSEKGFTSEEVLDVLRKAGANYNKLEELKKILSELETSRYSGASFSRTSEDIVKDTLRILKGIDKAL